VATLLRAAHIAKEKPMAVDHPFGRATIGSSVGLLGDIDDSVLLDTAQITTRVERGGAEMTMRGQSDLLYTTGMNQASIGVAGSYGVEGVQKVTAAVSAYFGYSSAELKKQTSVVYEIVQWGGYEYIKFDQLTPLEMLGSLSPAPQALAGQALDRYNQYMTKLDEILNHPYVEIIGWSIPEVFDFFRDQFTIQAKHKKLNLLASLVADSRLFHKQWMEKASEFRKNYGEGMVVGVLWGGIGQATMTIENKADAAAWKYGGGSKFSYEGIATSVAVEATYDASGSQDKSQIKVWCQGNWSGDCVANQVNSWTNTLNGKAFTEVSGIKPLGAPVISAKTSFPKAPAFVQPPKVQKETKQLTKDKVETAAKLATYDKAKALFEKMNPGRDFEKSINAFLERATTEKPKTGPMTNLLKDVAANRLSTRSLLT
jgi:hypothetical protein